MGWFRKLLPGGGTPDVQDEESVVRPQPQIIEVGDGEEGAELVFAETAPTTPSTEDIDLFAHSPHTLPGLEEEQLGPLDAESIVETASSVSLTKDLDQDMELRGKLMRRIVALLCLFLVLLAIVLGIVFGTKNDKNATIQTTSSEANNEVPTNINAIANEECVSASNLRPDGSSDVGIISAALDSSFTNGGGKCGTATYGIAPGKWYRYSASETGGSLTLSACSTGCSIPGNGMVIPEVSVFTGDCGGLYCVDGVSDLITNGPFEFRAIRGQDYFIYVQGGEGSLGLFEITLAAP